MRDAKRFEYLLMAKAARDYILVLDKQELAVARLYEGKVSMDQYRP